VIHADELRRAFDAGFAAAPSAPAPAGTDLLVFGLGALRLADVSSFHVDLAITALPATDPALLGIAIVRGAIVPVFDAARLLARPPGGALRWVAIVRGRGLAFGDFRGHARVAQPRDLIDVEAL